MVLFQAFKVTYQITNCGVDYQIQQNRDFITR